jgi:GNAT superfamily N-acetyltransferase
MLEVLMPLIALKGLRSQAARKTGIPLLLDALCVAEDFRSRGVGLGLVEQVKARAAAAEVESVSLIVFADNEPALRLYRRQGFEAVRRVDVAPHVRIPHQGGVPAHEVQAIVGYQLPGGFANWLV